MTATGDTATFLDLVAGVVPKLIINVAWLRDFEHNQDAFGGGLIKYALHVVTDMHQEFAGEIQQNHGTSGWQRPSQEFLQ